jgi:hypothetical protein
MTPNELAPRLWPTIIGIAAWLHVAPRAIIKIDHLMQMQIVKEVIELFETVII